MPRQIVSPRPTPPPSPSWARKNFSKTRSACPVNARPPVGDLDLDLAVELARQDVDGATGRRVLDGVLDEVDEHLLDEDAIEGHEREIARDAGPDVPPAQPVVEAVEGGAHDLLERLELLSDLERARVEARHVEQVPHEPVEALRLLVGGHDERRGAWPRRSAHAAPRRALVAPVTTARGVRRSCETRAEEGVAELLGLRAQGGPPRFLGERGALERPSR